MHASAPTDRGGMGTQIWWGEGAGYSLLLSALGMRSPSEEVSDPYSTASSCNAGAPGLAQTLVICNFGTTLAAESQRCFGIKCVSFRGRDLLNLMLCSNVSKQTQKGDVQ